MRKITMNYEEVIKNYNGFIFSLLLTASHIR